MTFLNKCGLIVSILLVSIQAMSAGPVVPILSGVSVSGSVTQPDIYSPNLVYQYSKLKMYFGGWDTGGMTHDAIYRADCPEPSWNGSAWVSGACSNAVKVLDAASLGFDALNDPSVVAMPGGYYLMYMTCVSGGQNGNTVTSNHLCWSMSWYADGVNWSAPQPLSTKVWLPSATIAANGHVYLYANSNSSDPTVPYLSMFDLGTSGIAMGAPKNVNVVGTNKPYLNVDVIYRAGCNCFQIFGQNTTATAIDYLVSWDGVNWYTGAQSIVTPRPGFNSVNTPAPHPNNNAFIYFGQTSQAPMSYSMFFREWY